MKYNKHSTKCRLYAMSNKGITLIALIVTIVVLLILAGVTIANISGNESVPNQAAKQRDKAKIAKEEQILTNAAISITNNKNVGAITENGLKDALSSYNVDVVKSGGLYRITFKDSNNLYKMDDEGEFFYWEDMEPTDIYAKKDGTILYLRSTQPDTSYAKGTAWNDSTITKVVIEEPIAPISCYAMFIGCSKLNTIENIEYLHTEKAESMEKMFYGCNKINTLNLKYFDTSSVTTMQNMFYYCNNLQEVDMSNLDTSNLTITEGMFRECHKITKIDLSNFNTEYLEDSDYMFYNCKNLKTIFVGKTWNSDNITSSYVMFRYNTYLKGGKGTQYLDNKTDKTYARIDDPANGKPGYFTEKP